VLFALVLSFFSHGLRSKRSRRRRWKAAAFPDCKTVGRIDFYSRSEFAT